jgi:hypothetical protein
MAHHFAYKQTPLTKGQKKIPLNHSLSISTTTFQTPPHWLHLHHPYFDIEDLQPCDVILHLNLLPITCLLKSFYGGHLSTLLAYILLTYLSIKEKLQKALSLSAIYTRHSQMKIYLTYPL